MERHGDASAHVYSLPSSRLRGASTSSAAGGTIPPSAQQLSTGTVSAGHSPVTEQTMPRMSGPPPVSNRKYDSQHWSLIFLKRSTTGLRSLPGTPLNEEGPPNLSPLSSTSSSAPPLPSYLIATLLHLPSQVLYAWPIALKGTSSGKCFVTQPSQPPPNYASFNLDAILSESIKVLSDVIQAWIKTSSMRESLRRKESKRQKGARKIGESEQDAIWLNDSLGLAELDQMTRLRTLERTWKDEGESITPPVASPRPRRLSQSAGTAPAGQSSPRSTTPRIEITQPVYPSTAQASSATAADDAIEKEITQWMNSASLSDFTRARPEVARKSAMSGSSSPSSSGTSSPVHKARKSVTFSDGISLGAGALAAASSPPATFNPSAHAYRPPFAPDITDLPPTPGEETSDAFALPPSVGVAPASSIPRPIMTTGLVGTSSFGPDAGLHSPKSPRRSGPGSASGSLDISKTISIDTSRSAATADNSLSPTMSAPSPTRHRRSISKLSQEMPLDEADEDEAASKKKSSKNAKGDTTPRLSPTQSFADIKSAFRSFKPVLGHKKKVSPT